MSIYGRRESIFYSPISGGSNSLEKQGSSITLESVREFSKKTNSLNDFIRSRIEISYSNIATVGEGGALVFPENLGQGRTALLSKFYHEMSKSVGILDTLPLSLEDKFAIFVLDAWARYPFVTQSPDARIAAVLHTDPEVIEKFRYKAWRNPKLEDYDSIRNKKISVEDIVKFERKRENAALRDFIVSRGEYRYQILSSCLRGENIDITKKTTGQELSDSINYYPSIAIATEIIDTSMRLSFEDRMSLLVAYSYSIIGEPLRRPIDVLSQLLHIDYDAIDYFITRNRNQLQESFKTLQDLIALTERMKAKGYEGIPTEFQLRIAQVINVDQECALSWKDIFNNLQIYRDGRTNNAFHHHIQTSSASLVACGEIEGEKIFSREETRLKILYKKITQIRQQLRTERITDSSQNVAAILEMPAATIRHIVRNFGDSFNRAISIGIQLEVFESVINQILRESKIQWREIPFSEELASLINDRLEKETGGIVDRSKRNAEFYKRFWYFFGKETNLGRRFNPQATTQQITRVLERLNSNDSYPQIGRDVGLSASVVEDIAHRKGYWRKKN